MGFFYLCKQTTVKRLVAIAVYVMFAGTLFGDTQHIQVSNAYVFSSIPGSDNTAAFVTITNNSDKPIALISASNSLGITTEIHTHIQENGIKKMFQVEKLEIAPKGTIELKPHSDHIMLIGLKKPLLPLQNLDLILNFSDDSIVTIKDVKVIERKHHE